MMTVTMANWIHLMTKKVRVLQYIHTSGNEIFFFILFVLRFFFDFFLQFLNFFKTEVFFPQFITIDMRIINDHFYYYSYYHYYY